MRTKIYKLFTMNNGVMLSSEILSYLESNVEESMLKRLVIEYRRRDGPQMGEMRIFKEIVEFLKEKPKDCGTYNVVEVKFKRKDDVARYKFLMSKVEKVIIPTYMLTDGSSGVVFGCYYKDKCGKEVLEDDGDVIYLDTHELCCDVFLCDGVFVALEGKMCGNIFTASSAHLPRIEKRVVERTNLVKGRMRFLFFCDFSVDEANSKLLWRILEEIPTDVVVLMGRLCSERFRAIPYSCLIDKSKESYRGVTPDIVLCPEADDVYPSFLPKRISIPDEQKALKAITNPSIIETVDKSIGIIRDDIFKAKKRGSFFGENYTDSFVKTVLSQYSFNPFSHSNLTIDALPDIIIVGQDFYPFATLVDDVLFVSCPSFKKETMFVSYDTSSNSPKTLSCKDIFTQNA